MQVVQLTKQYRNVNAGEFAGYSDREAEWILEHKLGRPAKAVRMLKPVLRKDAEQVLGKSWEYRRGAKVGQCLTLEAKKADELIGKGLAVELVQATVVAPIKNEAGVIIRETGTFACTKAELAEHQKNGVADVFVHPADDNEEEEAERETARQGRK